MFVAVTAAATAGIGWYYAGEIEREAFAVSHDPLVRDLIIAEVGDGTVTLRATAASDMDFGAWRMPGLWRLDWDGGSGRVGEILDLRDDEVVRVFTAVDGAPQPGTPAELRGTVYGGDPMTALGIPFEDVAFAGEFGPLAAWRVPGAANTWAILVHGKGQARDEMLRYLPALDAAGMPALVISYRNDEGVFASVSGRYDYGASEWRDLEAAVRYALDEGAARVVLFGESMGGGIVMSFLYHSELAGHVAAVVLDAPMLSFADTVDFGAERRGLPALLTWIGKTAAALRFGFSWEESDYIGAAARLKAPILIFHGDADRLVHIRGSEALAAARPDLVTLVRVAGAPHAHAWNMDPAAFEATLADFLAAKLVE